MPPVTRRIRQTRLQFAPLSSSSPIRDSYSSTVKDRLASVRHEGARQEKLEPAASMKIKMENLPTPEPSSQAQQEAPKLKSFLLAEPPSSPLSSPPPSTVVESDDDSVLMLRSAKLRAPDHQTPTRKSTRLQHRQNHEHKASISSSQTDSAEKTVSVKQLSDLGSPETSGNEDDIIVTRPPVRTQKLKKVKDDDFVVDDNKVEYVSSEEESVRKSSKRKVVELDDFVVRNDIVEFIDSDNATPPKSRKLFHAHKSSKTQRRRSRKEQEELEDDLEDLQVPESTTKSSRTRGGPVTTQKDEARKHFELLKRRRAGEKIPRVEDSNKEKQTPEGTDFDSDARDPIAFDLTDEGSTDSSIDSSIDTEQEVSDGEEYDDFIENDSPSRGRVPHPDIPLEFTSFASAKTKELFPHVIEWLIKNKVAPAFCRDDALYTLAFGRLDDQVKAQAGSRLISAAWNVTFKNAILARPNMKVVELPGLDIDNVRTCDACNKTNHPARYDFVFTGQAYHKRTLEPIDNSESDSEIDDVSSDASLDEYGHPLASQSQHFYLGRFCAGNAQMGHKLSHWKYQLNEDLLSHLEEQGVFSVEAVVKRDRMNKKQREKEAEAIADQMQATGMVTELWRGFQNNLEDARLGMEGYEKKGGPSRGRIGSVWQS